MRTTSLDTPFPLDLGSWLANFRYRRRDSRGHPFSPEQLGREIGVSGATVRRWESGRLRPNTSDAANLSNAYRLTPNQQAFLLRSLRQADAEPAAQYDLFRERSGRILGGDYPAYLLDTLYYIRAWNSYLPAVLARPETMRVGRHLIEYVIDAETELNNGAVLAERLRRLTREFWYFTADYCGSDAYRRLVLRLAASPAFKQEWCRLPFIEEDEGEPIGVWHQNYRPDLGSYRLMTSGALIPPIYLLREFMPVDDKAREMVDKMRQSGPPIVYFDSVSHWSHEPAFLTPANHELAVHA